MQRSLLTIKELTEGYLQEKESPNPVGVRLADCACAGDAAFRFVS